MRGGKKNSYQTVPLHNAGLADRPRSDEKTTALALEKGDRRWDLGLGTRFYPSGFRLCMASLRDFDTFPPIPHT